jgi:hypothetical protein
MGITGACVATDGRSEHALVYAIGELLTTDNELTRREAATAVAEQAQVAPERIATFIEVFNAAGRQMARGGGVAAAAPGEWWELVPEDYLPSRWWTSFGTEGRFPLEAIEDLQDIGSDTNVVAVLCFALERSDVNFASLAKPLRSLVLDDAQPDCVRLQALRVLQRRCPERLGPEPLIGLLGNSALRMAVVDSLRCSGRAAQDLIARCLDPVFADEMRYGCIWALGKLGGKLPKKASLELEALVEGNLGSYALWCLVQHREEGAIVLKRVAGRAERQGVERALAGIALIGEDATSAVETVIPFLEDEREKVAGLAAVALGRMRINVSDSVLDRLIMLGGKGGEFSRAAAVATLGRAGTERERIAWFLVQSASEEQPPSVRCAALKGLAALEGGQRELARVVVERALKDKDARVRWAAEDVVRVWRGD